MCTQLVRAIALISSSCRTPPYRIKHSVSEILFPVSHNSPRHEAAGEPARPVTVPFPDF